MTDFLYRFRRLDCLFKKDDLGPEYQNSQGFSELERQEICFAPYDNLNDPSEGYLDLVWKGDEILWTNLLKNYLLVLEDTFSWALLLEEGETLKDENIRVFKLFNDLPSDSYKERIKKIWQDFLNHPYIKGLPENLASRQNGIRREELIYYISLIHRIAINIVAKSLGHREFLMNDEMEKPFKDGVILKLIETSNRVELENSNISNISAKIFQAAQHSNQQLHFIAKNSSNNYDANIELLLVSFPSKYVEKLSSLVYPRWNTACFMEDSTNSAMWGHYGEEHKGVCFKFKTKSDTNSKRGISLYGINGSSMKKGDLQPTPTFGEIFVPFKKINYKKSYPTIEFFGSLGLLNMGGLYDEWAMLNGKVSEVFKKCNYETQDWRTKYWENFNDVVTTKLDDWKFETEHRLILDEMSSNKSELKHRLYKYNFSDLEGIIFGIKTPEEYKRKIVKIIIDKCQKESRTDFSFYQARYDNFSGKIEISKLSLFNLELE